MKDLIKGKVILITGGTGYLGRALTKKLLTFNPQSIRIFSRDEVKHHKFQQQFQDHPKIRNLIGDVRDYERLKRAMKGVDIVIHAAALKRIDIIEYNVDESIRTNIIGTMNVVQAALANQVKKAIYVSTDKACSPVNTYGACKFVGERIFIESNLSKGAKYPVFTAVRYGNVLESTGSVIPFFESKIKANEPIPLTDDRMTRFIISPEQAVRLILDAIKLGSGGDIFIPKLPAFKINDLIDILKEKHNANTPIETIGIRPGEKFHELMINAAEVPRTWSYKNLYIIHSHIQEHSSTPPIYTIKNNPLKESDMEEYSSEDEVVDKSKLKQLFSQFGII